MLACFFHLTHVIMMFCVCIPAQHLQADSAILYTPVGSEWPQSLLHIGRYHPIHGGSPFEARRSARAHLAGAEGGVQLRRYRHERPADTALFAAKLLLYSFRCKSAFVFSFCCKTALYFSGKIMFSNIFLNIVTTLVFTCFVHFSLFLFFSGCFRYRAGSIACTFYT